MFSIGFNKCKQITESPEIGLVAKEEGGICWCRVDSDSWALSKEIRDVQSDPFFGCQLLLFL